MAGPPRHRVVVVGGGFGGLYAVRGLADADAQVTLVDRRNFHLFQPLLYQVATGSLSPAEIAAPLRGLLRRQRNARVLLGEVTALDLEARTVTVTTPSGVEWLAYSTLVVAAGATHAYFGHDEWATDAPGLKSLEDALDIRRRILGAFEAAETEPDEERRRALLTFVVVGGGPTGVELAGQIVEIARDTLRRDFRAIDPAAAHVLLVDAADRILGAFHPALSRRATTALTELGVDVRTGLAVTGVTAEGVTLAGDGREETVAARTTIWAAGVRASPLATLLGAAAGVGTDGSGRLSVRDDLTLPGHPDVLVVGDMTTVDAGRGDGTTLAGVAPVAMQQGRHAAATIRARLDGAPGPGPFRYRDRGSVATIGRARAVAEIKGVRVWGLPAWLLWLGVHITYLAGFQNRLLVLVRWAFAWVTRGRGARLITGG